MGFGFKNFEKGFRLVPVLTTSLTLKGDLEVRDADGKLYLFNGTAAGAVVTEDGVATLTNKVIDGSFNTITNIPIGSLPANTATTNTAQTLTNKTMSGASNTFSNIGYSSLILTGQIVDGDVAAGAAIARTKLGLGTANHVVINSGTGAFSSEANLAITRGGTGSGTALGGFNALSPLTTNGDLLYHNGTNNLRLPIGSAGQVLKVSGGIPAWSSAATAGAIATKTSADSPYTLTSADDTILVNASGGNVVLNLPLSSANTGKIFQVKRIDSSTNTVSLNRAGGDTIDGATSTRLMNQYEEITVQADGSTTYEILSRFNNTISAHYQTNSNSFTTGGRIDFGATVLYDPFGTVTNPATNFLFTAPEAGVYQVIVGLETTAISGSVNSFFSARLHVNGVAQEYIGLSYTPSTSSYARTVNGSTSFLLAAGDTIFVAGEFNFGGSVTLSGNNDTNYIVIQRIKC